MPLPLRADRNTPPQVDRAVLAVTPHAASDSVASPRSPKPVRSAAPTTPPPVAYSTTPPAPRHPPAPPATTTGHDPRSPRSHSPATPPAAANTAPLAAFGDSNETRMARTHTTQSTESRDADGDRPHPRSRRGTLPPLDTSPLATGAAGYRASALRRSPTGSPVDAAARRHHRSCRDGSGSSRG